MHRVKPPGQRHIARDLDRHVAKLQIRAAVLTGVTHLGVPVTEVVGRLCPGTADHRPSDDLRNRATKGCPTPLVYCFLVRVMPRAEPGCRTGNGTAAPADLIARPSAGCARPRARRFTACPRSSNQVGTGQGRADAHSDHQ